MCYESLLGCVAKCSVVFLSATKEKHEDMIGGEKTLKALTFFGHFGLGIPKLADEGDAVVTTGFGKNLNDKMSQSDEFKSRI